MRFRPGQVAAAVGLVGGALIGAQLAGVLELDPVVGALVGALVGFLAGTALDDS